MFGIGVGGGVLGTGIKERQISNGTGDRRHRGGRCAENNLKLAEQFNFRELAIDRWNTTQLQQQFMDDGIEVVQFGQGFKSMTAPTKELDRLVACRKLFHNGDPVLRWNAANLMVESDPAGNLKPDKRRSAEKIDGMVAIIMALGRAIVTPDDPPSVYDERGLTII